MEDEKAHVPRPSVDHQYFEILKSIDASIANRSESAPPQSVYHFPEPMTQLLNSMCGIFKHVQSHTELKTSSSGEFQELLLNCSMQYRGEMEKYLRSAFQDLKKRATAATLRQDESYHQLVLLEQAKSVWHLSEIFFLDKSSVVTRQLVDWVHRLIAIPDPGPTMSSPDYWTAVYKCVLQGRLERALQYLTSNPAIPDLLKDALSDLFRHCPSLIRLSSSSSTHTSRAVADRLVLEHQNWQTLAEQLAVEVESDFPELSRVLFLCAGEDHFLLVRPGGSTSASDTALSWAPSWQPTWYEQLIGRLLYKDPQMHKSHISYLLDETATATPANDIERLHLYVIHGAATMDEPKRVAFVNLLRQALFAEPYLSAHFTDLLFHAGLFSADSELRKDCLLACGDLLAADRQLWELSSLYYQHAGGLAGLRRVGSLVVRQPITSDKSAMRLLDLAHHLMEAAAQAIAGGQDEFRRVRQTICLRWAHAALTQGRFGSAVTALHEGGFPQQAEAVCALLSEDLIGAVAARASSGLQTNSVLSSREFTAACSVTELGAVVFGTGGAASSSSALGIAAMTFLIRYVGYLRLRAEIDQTPSSSSAAAAEVEVDGKSSSSSSSLEPDQQKDKQRAEAVRVLVELITSQATPLAHRLHLLQELEHHLPPLLALTARHALDLSSSTTSTSSSLLFSVPFASVSTLLSRLEQAVHHETLRQAGVRPTIAQRDAIRTAVEQRIAPLRLLLSKWLSLAIVTQPAASITAASSSSVASSSSSSSAAVETQAPAAVLGRKRTSRLDLGVQYPAASSSTTSSSSAGRGRVTVSAWVVKA